MHFVSFRLHFYLRTIGYRYPQYSRSQSYTKNLSKTAFKCPYKDFVSYRTNSSMVKFELISKQWIYVLSIGVMDDQIKRAEALVTPKVLQ